MPFEIIRADITTLKVDAIVNAANSSLMGGGGVDGAIHRAAGRQLNEECKALGGCDVGDAKITKGYGLPAKYIIHTVGPRWRGGRDGEEAVLRSCYRRSLTLAGEKRMESIAFPLISSGIYGYPKDAALQVASSEIQDFLKNADEDMLVYLVIFDRAAFEISEELFEDVVRYVDDHFVDKQTKADSRRFRSDANVYQVGQVKLDKTSAMESRDDYGKGNFDIPGFLKKRKSVKKAELKEELEAEEVDESVSDSATSFLKSAAAAPAAESRSLDDLMNQMDATFSEMLLRLIDERGQSDSEVYKKANVDRRLFSKIRKDKHYVPSKKTVLSFAIALELSLDETKDLLLKAGFALSRSNKADIVVEYFIINENYDIFEMNEVLFKLGLKLMHV